MQENTSLENRLENLECNFVFQQETIDTLNEQVTSQWQKIDMLTKKLEALTNQMTSFENELFTSETGDTPEPPPPHY